MASIYKRKNKNGTTVWRAVVRFDDYPAVCNHFDRKQEAVDWATEIERQIKAGKYNFHSQKQKYTFSELVARYTQDGVLELQRSAADTKRHLSYWESRLGKYGLVYIKPDLLGKERQILLDTPTTKGTNRTRSTVNRYMSSLSSLLSYAKDRLEWIDENPALRLIKLKENRSRDRVLSKEEIDALLKAARLVNPPISTRLFFYLSQQALAKEKSSTWSGNISTSKIGLPTSKRAKMADLAVFPYPT